MEPKHKIWLAIGISLMVVGYLASKAEQDKYSKNRPQESVFSQQAKPPVVNPPITRPRSMTSQPRSEEATKIDPIRGLREGQDLDDISYFQ